MFLAISYPVSVPLRPWLSSHCFAVVGGGGGGLSAGTSRNGLPRIECDPAFYNTGMVVFVSPRPRIACMSSTAASVHP